MKKTTNKKTIVFIIGAGHSGSTLLDKALGSHSMAFSLGEIININEEFKFSNSPCGCGESIKNCDFWKEIITKMNINYNINFEDNPDDYDIRINLPKNKFIHLINLLLPFKFYTKPIKDKLSKTQFLYDNIVELTGKKILIDSSKNLYRSILLKKYLDGYCIKYIHLIRNGKEVLLSSQKKTYKKNYTEKSSGKKIIQEIPRKEKNPKNIILQWRKINIISFSLLRLINRRSSILLRYEDFSSNPESTLHKLSGFLNIPYDKNMIKLNNTTNHMVSGNVSRLNATEIKKIPVIWQKSLSDDLIRLFNKKAQWLNRIFGYK